MTDDKVAEIKKIISENNFPKYPRVDKVGVFVGNLPYTYTEKEIGDLFAEYGITNIALVKGTDGMSKGFAFIEVMLFVSYNHIEI
jgi:RNA recognition motif-containing protein